MVHPKQMRNACGTILFTDGFFCFAPPQAFKALKVSNACGGAKQKTIGKNLQIYLNLILKGNYVSETDFTKNIGTKGMFEA